jgi:hypothetical protein
MCQGSLLSTSDRLQVDLSKELRDQIESGFGNEESGEDAFDAFVGLLGMIEVVRGNRPAGVPKDDRILQIEGWILGQKARPLTPPPGPPRPLDVVDRKKRSRRSGEVTEGGRAAALKAWETMRARYDPEDLAKRWSAGARKAGETMRAKKAQQTKVQRDEDR